MDPADYEPLLAAWDAALAAADRAATTRRSYGRAVRAFIAWYEQAHREPFAPAGLTPIDLTGYRAVLQQQQAPASVNLQLGALRTFCAWLATTGQCVASPAARLRSVGQAAAGAPRSLSPAQANALLREAQRTRHAVRDYALLQLLLQTGLRISECAALRLGDLHLGERQGQLQVRAGKGNSARTVPLNGSARQALAAYLAPLLGTEPSVRTVGVALDSAIPATPLWRSQKGGALAVRTIAELVETLVAACAARGLVPPEASAHTLRHTFATAYLADHPGDLVGLAALLGHRSLETTRIYVQPSQADLARRVEALRLNAYE